MVDDLAVDEDGAGRSVADRDEGRTSPELETTRLAATSPTEARKET
jgi:hypothetical protein